MTEPTPETEPSEPDNPAAWALARHIADHPMSTIQTAFSYLNAPLTVELHETPSVPLPPADHDTDARAEIERLRAEWEAERRELNAMVRSSNTAAVEARANRTAVLRQTEALMRDAARDADEKALSEWDAGYASGLGRARLLLRRMADETAATEAHPAEHTWAAELHDPAADEWVPSTRYKDRDRAVAHLTHAAKIGPTWKDGTSTQRRLVRATTTYTVEQPAAGAPGLRGLLEHVGIDTTGRDITVAGAVVDTWPVDETAGTETQADRATHPCNAATMHRLGNLATAHGPHPWEPQPGMEPVHCPGTRKPPMDPVHILGIESDDEPAAGTYPPAAAGLPAGTVEAAEIGAARLDAWARTPQGRNFLAHTLVQLARTGWLRSEPGECFEPMRDTKPVQPVATARQDGARS